MHYTPPTDLVKSSEARKLLGISRLKMATLLKSGVLRYFPDPLDDRVKLVSRADVNALLLGSGKKAA